MDFHMVTALNKNHEFRRFLELRRFLWGALFHELGAISTVLRQAAGYRAFCPQRNQLRGPEKFAAISQW